MNTITKERIKIAKSLLGNSRHGTMATVNPDGSPHNTPFYLILDKSLEHVYFGSYKKSLHSQNVVRTGQLFVVVYDAVKPDGVYMQAIHGKELSGEELDAGLRAHNEKRAKEGKKPLAKEYYSENNPQRMYGAEIVTFWVNDVERGSDGLVTRDIRIEIPREALL